MGKKYLCFIFLFSSFLSFASDLAECPNIDIRHKAGPKIDQQDVGWCYAIVASHLLNSFGQERASFVHLAMQYNNVYYKKQSYFDSFFNKVKFESTLQYGYTHKVLDLVKKQSFYCKGHDQKNYSLKQRLDFIENLHQDYKKNKSIKLCTQEGFLTEDIVSQLFPNISHAELVDTCKKVEWSKFLDTLAQSSCEKVSVEDLNWKLDKKGFSQRYDDFQKTLVPKINNILRSEQPIGITFNANILNNPKTEVKVNSHISTIVGQRFNRTMNRCEYLLNDSIEESYYHSDWEKEGALLWISRDSLINLSDSIVYIETN